MSKKTQAAEAPPALAGIIDRAQVLAQHREQLGTMVAALNRGIEALKADALPQLRTAIEESSSAWVALEASINEHPELFTKPRSIEAHGIKFGFAKGKGKGSLKIADPATTIKLIKKHLPELANVLISTLEIPAKTAIANLTAGELKKIGVEIEGTDDTVFIKPADGAVDKLVKALVAAAVDEAT